MEPLESELIDWTVCAATRSSLGPNFVRILGYFREDGTDSVSKIEEETLAVLEEDASPVVRERHPLGFGRQFG